MVATGYLARLWERVGREPLVNNDGTGDVAG
jgi:hypothetical protein